MRRKPAKPVQARRDTPREFRLAGGCAIQAAEGEGKLGTFEGNAYTGAPMRPSMWWNDVIIDLDGVQVPSQHRPALRQHDHEQVVGHTTSVTVDEEGIKIAGVFSGQPEHVAKVVVPAKNGFQWQLSVGADPVRTEFLEAGEETEVNGRKVVGPMTISRETRIGEISFVPLGADGDTSVQVAAQRGHRTMNHWHLALKELMASLKAASKLKAAKYTDAEIDEMTADEARANLKKCMEEEDAEAADDDEEDDDEGEKDKKEKAEAARRQKLQAEADQVIAGMKKRAAAEHVRQEAIRAAARKHGVTEVEIDDNGTKRRVNLVAHAIEHDWPVERAELYALRAERPAAGVGVPGGLAYVPHAPQMTEEVLEAAVLQAARHQFRLEDDSFYQDAQPGGGAPVRRVSERIQRETQRDLRARYTDQVQQAAHTIFRGRITPKMLLAAAFRANGHPHGLDLSGEHGVRTMLEAWDHMERTRIVAEGASNLSISNILANVLNKFALQGYLFVEQAWREIAGIRPVNDFKPAKSINLLGDVMYKALGPTGELSNANLADQAFANQAQPYGRILTIPWTHLVNDDLGMLTGVPLKLGQGAGLALNDYFWALWASLASGSVVGSVPSGTSLNGDDGTSFWRTGSSTTKNKQYNKNKISGASSALSSTSLQTAKAVFDNQIDPNGYPLGFDGSMPVLLHGPTNWKTVSELLEAAYILMAGLASTSAASLQPNKNIWQGAMKPVMSRYIENANYGNSTTAWWILYNPAALPVIEVAFLNGVDTPAVLQASPDYQFDRLGISIRGTMPFGVTQQNFRGGVYSVGA